MILTVDTGNSRTKWGVFDDSGQLQQAGAVDNHDLAQLLRDWSALAGVRRAVISSVATEAVSGQLERICETLNLSPHWVSASAAACGVRNDYKEPEKLGTDRWAAVIAAWNEYHAACIVASVGTALTVDALSGDGELLGGLIVPGLRMMNVSLSTGTAAVGDISGRWSDFPVRTSDAVHSGALAAMGGAVRHMRSLLEAREGQTPYCLLGGGDADALATTLDFPLQLAPHLILKGLFLMESARV